MNAAEPRPVTWALLALVCAGRGADAEALWWLRRVIEESHPQDSGEGQSADP